MFTCLKMGLLSYFVLLIVFPDISLAEYRHYINKGSDENINCGCPPDAALATRLDSKALLFSDNSYWLFDIYEDSDSIADTRLDIQEFPGLEENIDAAFSTTNEFYFIKENRFWVFNEDRCLLYSGNTQTDWELFPHHLDAVQYLGEINNEISQIDVITDDNIFLCNVTRTGFKINCATSGYRDYNKLERKVGFPIRASVSLRDGSRIIFGSTYMCISQPPHESCTLFCHPQMLPCPSDTSSQLILIAVLSLMFVACLVSGVYYCENVTSASSLKHRRGA